jgi:hypothetical protein
MMMKILRIAPLLNVPQSVVVAKVLWWTQLHGCSFSVS